MERQEMKKRIKRKGRKEEDAKSTKEVFLRVLGAHPLRPLRLMFFRMCE
jgi:hypothetical protein